MLFPIVYFRIRVSEDEKHAIYCEDFDAFEDFLVSYGLNHLNEGRTFFIEFVTVPDDEDEEIPF